MTRRILDRRGETLDRLLNTLGIETRWVVVTYLDAEGNEVTAHRDREAAVDHIFTVYLRPPMVMTRRGEVMDDPTAPALVFHGQALDVIYGDDVEIAEMAEVLRADLWQVRLADTLQHGVKLWPDGD